MAGNDTSSTDVGQEIRYEDGHLWVGDLAIQVFLHDPGDDPQPMPDGERLEIQHPADFLGEDGPSGIYSPDGRPDDEPCVSVQVATERTINKIQERE